MHLRFSDMKSSLICLSLFMVSFTCSANDKQLTFSYWSEAGPPFVFLADSNQQEIENGLVKDLAELISTRLAATPKYVNIPVKRIESQLYTGAIDFDCITNPIWKQQPKDYHWSPALFKGADRFMIKSSRNQVIDQFTDLKGKTLGIYKSYTYHPKIMKMIKDGDINTVKLSNIDHGIKLLQLDRIDALIDFDIILNYKIKHNHPKTLALADLYAEKYDLFCAYSKKVKFEKVQLDKIFNNMITQGEISQLLLRYK